MSFSTGFKDGFGYYKAFSDMEQDKLLTGARLKTEELRQQAYQSDITESEETRDVRMEGIKAQSDFQVARAEKTRAETDEFIAHTNGDDIRAANNENAEKTLQANTEFSTSDNQVELPDMIAECEEEEQTTSEITEDELTEVISEDDEVTIDEEDVTFEL